jgi:hypothetical protein
MTVKGMLLRLAGTIAAAALVFAGAPGVATAAPQADSFYWIKFAAGLQRCLDSNAQGSVYTHDCQDGNDNQKWNNYKPGKFKNKKTGWCLAAGASSVFTTANCDSNATDWRTSSTTNKYFTNVSTRLCLNNRGGDGEAVGLRVCRAGTALWTETHFQS